MNTKLILLLIPLVWFSGCGFSEDIKEAEKFMNAFFENRIQEGNAGSDDFYSKIFIDSTTDKKWNTIKVLVMKAHGKLVSYEQVNWQIKNQKHTSELSGTFVYYIYKTSYEKGEGIEKITLFKNSENPKFKIISHNYNSTRIQELVDQGIEKAAQTEF